MKDNSVKYNPVSNIKMSQKQLLELINLMLKNHKTETNKKIEDLKKLIPVEKPEVILNNDNLFLHVSVQSKLEASAPNMENLIAELDILLKKYEIAKLTAHYAQ